jgi:hypothetical protein
MLRPIHQTGAKTDCLPGLILLNLQSVKMDVKDLNLKTPMQFLIAQITKKNNVVKFLN